MFATNRSRQTLVFVLMSPAIAARLTLMSLVPFYILNPNWMSRRGVSYEFPRSAWLFTW